MVILDTSVIIDHLRTGGKGYLLDIAKGLPKQNLTISTITIQELYEGKSTKDKRKEKDMLSIISPLTIVPYTFDTAQLAGEIARDLNRPIELADAAIAATTILSGASLATLNKKDFIGIESLELF
jgi:predicted nucleic acid-binding protein